MKSLSATDVCRGLVLIALVISPFNIKGVAGLRPSDFALLSALILFAISARKVKVAVLVLLAALAAIIFSRTIFYADSSYRLDTLIFSYKYALLFLTPLLGCNLFCGANLSALWIERLAKALMLHLWIMVVWALTYNVARNQGLLEGHWRLSFPMSEDYGRSDAHLYSTVLGLAIFNYLAILRRTLRHGAFTAATTCALALIALALTGSRGGVILLLFALFLWQASKVRAVPVLSTSIMGFLALWAATLIAPIEPLFVRALNFDLSVDASALGRLDKLKLAFSQVWVENPLFGVGFNEAAATWYDGLHAIVLVHWGFVGLLVLMSCILILGILILKLPKDQFWVKNALFSLFATIVLANAITEYALVTRGLIPFSLTLVFLLSVSKYLIAQRGRVQIGKQLQWS